MRDSEQSWYNRQAAIANLQLGHIAQLIRMGRHVYSITAELQAGQVDLDFLLDGGREGEHFPVSLFTYPPHGTGSELPPDATFDRWYPTDDDAPPEGYDPVP